ncbi:MAG: histidine--tRNA ligase [Chloroflexi bacterium]|nr:histidine--tRNA ligase [Chloroflexota bacterium]
MPIKPQILKGTRDLLPPAMILRHHVIDTLEAVFERFGFEPLETPAMEYAATLEGKLGEEERLMYRFLDAGERMVALRYDLTVPLARVIAMHQHELTMPFKRYQIAPVWRAEKPQKGRYREFWQCDADIVGTKSMVADAECIALMNTGLRELGFSSFKTLINNRKLLVALAEYAGVDRGLAVRVYRAVDKLEKIGPENVREEMLEYGITPEAAGRVLDLVQTEGTSRELLERFQRAFAGQPAGLQGVRELQEILDNLEAMEISDRFYAVDLSLARGLDYYTGPVYETIVEEPKIGSLTGGGRYDELLGLFTGTPLPMTGTSFGLERIVDVLQEMHGGGLAGTTSEVMVTVFSPELLAKSLRLAGHLRLEGVHTEVYYDAGDSLGKQLKYASRKRVPFAVIMGPDEAAAGKITVRDMASGDQRTLSETEAAGIFRAWVERRGTMSVPVVVE